MDPATDTQPKRVSKFAALALSQDFAASVGAVQTLTKVPVKRPHKQDWWRVHPSEDYRSHFGLIDFKEDECVYAVMPELHPELGDIIEPFTLFTAINRQKVLSLMPVRLAGLDGKEHDAWKSLRAAAAKATKSWVQVQWSKPLGAYEMRVSTYYTDDPDWTERPSTI